MEFLGWQSNPVGKVEPEDEVRLDLQKAFAKFYNQSYLQNQGERREREGAWSWGKCCARPLNMRNKAGEVKDSSLDGLV